jgi:hypothetical protein
MNWQTKKLRNSKGEQLNTSGNQMRSSIKDKSRSSENEKYEIGQYINDLEV